MAESGAPVPVDFATVIGDTALLQQAAHYRTIRKTLRGSGIASLFFGAIGVAMGIGMLAQNPINIVLVFIGVFLLVEGSWLLLAPSPAGIIVDGIGFLILGSWNVFITIANAAAGAGGESTGRVAVMAIVQIAWGCHAFVRYKRYSKVPMVKPAPETMAYLDEIAKEVVKGKVEKDPAQIDFSASAFMGTQFWKGKLLPGYAILVTTVGHEFLILGREEFGVEVTGKVLVGKTLKAQLRLGDRKMKGTLSPVSYERYQAWQAGASAGEKSDGGSEALPEGGR